MTSSFKYLARVNKKLDFEREPEEREKEGEKPAAANEAIDEEEESNDAEAPPMVEV